MERFDFGPLRYDMAFSMPAIAESPVIAPQRQPRRAARY